MIDHFQTSLAQRASSRGNGYAFWDFLARQIGEPRFFVAPVLGKGRR